MGTCARLSESRTNASAWMGIRENPRPFISSQSQMHPNSKRLDSHSQEGCGPCSFELELRGRSLAAPRKKRVKRSMIRLDNCPCLWVALVFRTVVVDFTCLFYLGWCTHCVGGSVDRIGHLVVSPRIRVDDQMLLLQVVTKVIFPFVPCWRSCFATVLACPQRTRLYSTTHGSVFMRWSALRVARRMKSI